MKTCPKCNVKILDDTDRCPLCRHALSGPEGGLHSYPDAVRSIRKARMLENMFLFLSVIGGFAMVCVNYLVNPDYWWSLIGILALIYINVVLRYAILGRSGYQAKVYGLVILALLMLEGIDFLTGDRGWALSYVYPSGIMALEVTILILMLVNRRNWQSYMLPQIMVFLMSLLSFVFYWTGLVTHMTVAFVAMIFTLFSFLGTLILGDQRARNEMKRRFHI